MATPPARAGRRRMSWRGDVRHVAELWLAMMAPNQREAADGRWSSRRQTQLSSGRDPRRGPPGGADPRSSRDCVRPSASRDMPAKPGTHHIVARDGAARLAMERQRQAQQADHRGTAAERGYDSRWQRARDGYLRKHPLCCCCAANGRVTPADVVDHIVPHKGCKMLFWERDNWQGLCERCHRVIKAKLERRYMLGDADARHLRLDYVMPHMFIEAV
jgi:5-methylcytosine-specific restriction enzyme A